MDVLSGNPAVDLRARIAYRVWQGCIQKAAAYLRMNGLNRNNTSTSQSKGGAVLNYKWIRVLRIIYAIAIVAILVLIFTRPPQASAFRRALPAVVALGVVILMYAIRAFVFPCPRCGKHKTTAAFGLSHLRKYSVFYCPDCGEELRFTPKGGGQE